MMKIIIPNSILFTALSNGELISDINKMFTSADSVNPQVHVSPVENTYSYAIIPLSSCISE